MERQPHRDDGSGVQAVERVDDGPETAGAWLKLRPSVTLTVGRARRFLSLSDSRTRWEPSKGGTANARVEGGSATSRSATPKEGSG